MTTELLELPLEDVVVPTLPDLYEVVNGEIVECPPMSPYSVEVAHLLNDSMRAFLAAQPLGRTRVEYPFLITAPGDEGRVRLPDLAFVSFDRWPRNRPIPRTGHGLAVVPELVVEVVSPNDKVEELMTKTAEYLAAGAQQVWHIHPVRRLLYVFDSLTQVRGFLHTDTVPGDPVLSGFSFRLADVLPETEPDPTNGEA